MMEPDLSTFSGGIPFFAGDSGKPNNIPTPRSTSRLGSMITRTFLRVANHTYSSDSVNLSAVPSRSRGRSRRCSQKGCRKNRGKVESSFYLGN